MELQVIISLSDRLFGLLEDKLPNLGRRVEKVLTKELGRQVREQSEITVTATSANQAVAEAPDNKAVNSSSKSQNLGAEGAKGTTPQTPIQTAKKEHRDLPVEIREIMHRTRMRFEGENYKEDTDSEGYKKYHRTLTKQFKQIAIMLGFEKPSVINIAEKVDAFGEECDALMLDENGLITPPCTILKSK